MTVSNSVLTSSTEKVKTGPGTRLILLTSLSVPALQPSAHVILLIGCQLTDSLRRQLQRDISLTPQLCLAHAASFLNP
jgi:hypothetical protein